MVIMVDGKGRGFKQSVSSTQRGNVSGKVNPRSYYVSRNEGQVFSYISKYSATTGDVVFYLQNIDFKNRFIVSKIFMGAVNDADWQLNKVIGTASGTTITGKSLNFTKNLTAQSAAFGNAAVTGLTTDFEFDHARSLGLSTVNIDLKESLILGNNDAIDIIYTGANGNIEVVLIGYFEEHGEAIN